MASTGVDIPCRLRSCRYLSIALLRCCVLTSPLVAEVVFESLLGRELEMSNQSIRETLTRGTVSSSMIKKDFSRFNCIILRHSIYTAILSWAEANIHGYGIVFRFLALPSFLSASRSLRHEASDIHNIYVLNVIV